MTNRQKELTREAIYLQKKIEVLTQELNKTQNEYIEVANKLFDSIDDKKKVKILLNNNSKE